MCGIAGIYRPNSQWQPPMASLRAMAAAIAHRGPDGEGFFVRPGVGLAHRRLSIIDISAGQQPMISGDGNCAIVYNGELYNYMPLRAELAALGHVFRTRSDTEVILEAWLRWGPECLKHFRGMFAFAIWDGKRNGLFLARDRIGIKPLHFTWLPCGGLAFGSELKAILALGGRTPDQFNDQAALDYLALGYVPDPKTILKGIEKLAPGHCMWVAADCPTGKVSQYWDLPLTPVSLAASSDFHEELRARLHDAVSSHLVADVPISSFLSGGVDSSIVTLLMARASANQISAFSIGFADARMDESAFASEVAGAIGATHRLQVVDIDAGSSLESLAECYDEPFGDSSALPTYKLCALTQQHSKVALSGDGGDEVFLGYPWYFTHRRRVMMQQLIRERVRRGIGAVARRMRRRGGLLGRIPGLGFIASLDAGLGGGYMENQLVASIGPGCTFIGPALVAAQRDYGPEQRFNELLERTKDLDPLRAAQYADFKMYLPGDILTKVDRASMARSLEVRVPLLDHQLVEWACRQPVSALAPGGVRKGALKQSFANQLPASVFQRSKQGFSIPIDRWFREATLNSLFEEQVLRNEVLLDLGWIDRSGASGLLQRHVAKQLNAGSVLWSLVALGQSVNRLVTPRRMARI